MRAIDLGRAAPARARPRARPSPPSRSRDSPGRSARRPRARGRRSAAPARRISGSSEWSTSTSPGRPPWSPLVSAEHPDRVAGRGRQGHHAAGAEALVVGVREDRQQTARWHRRAGRRCPRHVSVRFGAPPVPGPGRRPAGLSATALLPFVEPQPLLQVRAELDGPPVRGPDGLRENGPQPAGFELVDGGGARAARAK